MPWAWRQLGANNKATTGCHKTLTRRFGFAMRTTTGLGRDRVLAIRVRSPKRIEPSGKNTCLSGGNVPAAREEARPPTRS